MLTPQDISEKAFVKAVFGGYDMEGVDDFLEAIAADYNSLYKENAILKGKLKVLVEKVEEYRTTEDAMRMALLTAQRMGEEITHEANKNRAEMLENAEKEIKAKLGDTAKLIADEEMRLAICTKETSKFIELSHAIIRKHTEFLEKLEAVRRSAKQSGAPGQSASDSGGTVKQTRSAKQAHPAKQAQPAKPVQPVMQTAPTIPIQPVMQTQPVMPNQPVMSTPPVMHNQSAPVQEVVFDDIAEQIGSVVGKMTDNVNTSFPHERTEAPSFDDPPSSLFENEAENTTPRPKFDFDDLKFGANFDSDE